MVGIDDFNAGAAARGFMDSLSASVYPVILTALGIALIAFFWWYFSHRHRVRIRLLLAQGTVPFDDKAREVIVDGVPFWKLLKRKDMIPTPTSEAMTHLGKGFLSGKPRFYAEFYWSEEYGYVPMVDGVNSKNLQDKAVKYGPNKELVKDAFHPFTPQQRALYVLQLRKAEARKKKSILDQITAIAVPMALVFIFIMLLVFWEDIAKPAQEMATANAGMMELNEKLLKQNAEISAQNARIVQALSGQIDAAQLQISQTVGGTG